MVKSNLQRPSLTKAAATSRFAVWQSTKFQICPTYPNFYFLPCMPHCSMLSISLPCAFVGRPCARLYLTLGYAFQHFFCPCLVIYCTTLQPPCNILHQSIVPGCFRSKGIKCHYVLPTLAFTLCQPWPLHFANLSLYTLLILAFMLSLYAMII
jgi:hypothetical protein